MESLLKFISRVSLYGPANLLRKIKYRFKIRVLQNFKQEIITNTSLTDSDLYKDYSSFCSAAAKDKKVFSKFRTYKEIIDVLDHVTIEAAHEYLKEIENFANWNEDFSRTLTHLDSIGDPFTYKFKNGEFSPTSLRYLKTYLEIESLFGNLEGYNITEIGVGFGGQAAIFQLLSKPKSYTLYDLKSTLDLAKAFLTDLKVGVDCYFYDGTKPELGANVPNLIISNYAFSELRREIQDKYLENIILKSAKGYITWNQLSQEKLDGYSLADLIRKIPNSQILPETPNTHIGNAIIVWGH